jgi:hypothetical protein
MVYVYFDEINIGIRYADKLFYKRLRVFENRELRDIF